MSRKRFQLLIFGFAFTVVSFFGAQAAMGQTATSINTTIKEPLNFVSTTCDTLEPVTFTGSQETVYELVNDGAGVLSLNLHSDWQNVLGTTVTGLVYHGTSTFDTTIDVESLPSEQTVTLSHRWLGKNDAPTMVYTLKFKVNIAANGSVTSQKTSEIVECQ